MRELLLLPTIYSLESSNYEKETGVAIIFLLTIGNKKIIYILQLKEGSEEN